VSSIVDHNVQVTVVAHDLLDRGVGRGLRCHVEFNRPQINIVLLRELRRGFNVRSIAPAVSRMLA